jgi:Universal stress protein family
MVVADAQGMSGFKRAILGSVSTGLVQHAHLPVLVVPGSASGVTTDGPLLLCYDGSDLSARAIDKASDLLARKDALVLHVWQSWLARVPALAGLSGSVTGVAMDSTRSPSSSRAIWSRMAYSAPSWPVSGWRPLGLCNRSGLANDPRSRRPARQQRDRARLPGFDGPVRRARQRVERRAPPQPPPGAHGAGRPALSAGNGGET